MSVRSFLRLTALLGAVAAMMALGSSSALAVNKPLVKLNLPQKTLNSVTLNGEVNPNGTATTYQWVYGPPSNPLEHYSEPVSVGEGTNYVKASLKLSSLYPATGFVYRLLANYSGGQVWTAQSGAESSRWWATEGKVEAQFPATYSSVGTVTIKAPIYFSSMTCKESGHGTIGHIPGNTDEITLELSACSVAGYPNCQPVLAGGGVIRLGGNFASKEPPTLMAFSGESPKCPFETVTLPATEAFAVTRGAPGVNLPITLFANSSIGSNPVTISDSSTWSLTGANAGLGFYFG